MTNGFSLLLFMLLIIGCDSAASSGEDFSATVYREFTTADMTIEPGKHAIVEWDVPEVRDPDWATVYLEYPRPGEWTMLPAVIGGLRVERNSSPGRVNLWYVRSTSIVEPENVVTGRVMIYVDSDCRPVMRCAAP